MPFDTHRANRMAGLFVLSGCGLGALLGYGWTLIPRGRRG